MEFLLHIETSGTCCSVCLSEQGTPIDTEEVKSGYKHAELLHAMTQQLLARNGLTGISPAAISVGSGPGSYTGLRIGVAFAKGLCMGYNIPLIAVSSLAGLSAQAQRIMNNEHTATCWMPMMDARRMEVYTACFSGNGEIITTEHAAILNEEFLDRISAYKSIFYFGDGAEKAIALMQGIGHAIYLEGIYCSAVDQAGIAWKKWQERETENIDTFDPLYLKEFIVKTKKTE